MSSILAVWLFSDLGLMFDPSTLGSSPTNIGASYRTRESGGVTATSNGAVSFIFIYLDYSRIEVHSGVAILSW